jgi:hypothetical protein
LVVSGGHAWAHPPVQVEVGPLSASNKYTARPWVSVRIVPRALCAVVNAGGSGRVHGGVAGGCGGTPLRRCRLLISAGAARVTCGGEQHPECATSELKVSFHGRVLTMNGCDGLACGECEVPPQVGLRLRMRPPVTRPGRPNGSMRAAATLCDWLSGRRRCSVSRPVRDELAGSADSDVDNGIGGRVRGAKIFETGGVSDHRGVRGRPRAGQCRRECRRWQ